MSKWIKISLLVVGVFSSSFSFAQTTGRGLTDFLIDYMGVKYSEDFKEFIYIGIKRQKLYHIKNDSVYKVYNVSCATKGAGNQFGSYKTPIGLHSVLSKIGDQAPIGMIFKDRLQTGMISEIYTDTVDRKDDVITTRIMWLSGRENGVNTGKSSVDSKKRFIYIHGTAEEGLIGTPASHGCIRMKNLDVIELFDEVTKGLKVIIINN